jgi:hypothetical protein
LRADVFFIRTQSTIRADGCRPRKCERGSWRYPPKFAEVDERICALRAPTVFLVRIRIIRTKNTVLDKGKNGLGLFLSKIADCVRTASRPRNVTTVQ